MADHETPEAAPVGKKTNIILTYEELAGIHGGIQKISGELALIHAEVKRIGEEHTDHEIRIRALELSQARSSGSAGFAQWATPVLLSIGMAAVAVLNYLK